MYRWELGHTILFQKGDGWQYDPQQIAPSDGPLTIATPERISTSHEQAIAARVPSANTAATPAAPDTARGSKGVPAGRVAAILTARI
jgi:hypothetical protein